jgi:hypothetical protein
MGIGDLNNFTGGPATPHVAGQPVGDASVLWQREEEFWRSSYARRPYALSDRDYRYYRPAYQYGFHAAHRYQGREWADVEPELERDWPNNRGETNSTWADVKDAVRDAWDRVRGRKD